MLQKSFVLISNYCQLILLNISYLIYELKVAAAQVKVKIIKSYQYHFPLITFGQNTFAASLCSLLSLLPPVFSVPRYLGPHRQKSNIKQEHLNIKKSYVARKTILSHL
jgi:predicted permease